jgi:hypothetical protein
VHFVPAAPAGSVVFGVTSRGPAAAALPTENVASTWVGETNETAVVVTSVPDTVIVTPLEKWVPVTCVVCVVPVFCELGLSAVMVGGDGCEIVKRQPHELVLPSARVRVGW